MKKNNKNFIVSNQNTGFHYYFIISVATFAALLTSYSALTFNFEEGADYINFYSCIAVGIASLSAIYYCIASDIIEVYFDRLEIKYFYGKIKKIIPRNEIVAWDEMTKKSKYGDYEIVIIFTDKTKYKFDRIRYENYFELKNAIVTNQLKMNRRDGYLKKIDSRFNTIIVIISVLFLLTVFLIEFFHK